MPMSIAAVVVVALTGRVVMVEVGLGDVVVVTVVVNTMAASMQWL